MQSYSDQIRGLVPGHYTVLGTDGYGRSDLRSKLREFFEVNRHYVVLAALKSLVEDDKISASALNKAIKKYGIDTDKPNPMYV